ncbi:MAG: right-handed parallel beta-helix repeat-containing protein [Duncaniella sp.]|uniref:right-handed parallel beta-helix repeat-containing protein n=1 Tax=Duncaniella sp. TaxID=2518496 RepID=UPI0023D4356A|nr:right-handed parallel beta-helix repeat-containing protein [Duncaniella sp.]MDE6089466.1 right-handed parallel beta-helix repeat-containing protein [Duncaniella sp.]
MKKYLYSLLALSSCALVACNDDTDNIVPNDPDMIEGQEHMTLFLSDNNTGMSDDAHSSHVDTEVVNKIFLSWSRVDGCAGYHIRVCNAQSVLGHPENWLSDTYLHLDTIMKPEELSMTLEHLEYSQVYYFSIRTLSEKARRADGSIDMDSPYHSKWFGHGSTSDWANYFGLTTGDRYDVPDVLSFDDKTETSIRVKFDNNVATAGLGDASLWEEHFMMEDGKFIFDQLHFAVSTSNPDSEMNDPNFTYDAHNKRYVHVLTKEEIEQGYVEVTNLSPNSAYVVNLYNSKEPVYVDAVYNTVSPRTAGQVGEPILIEWKEENVMSDTVQAAHEYKCSRLDTIIANYNKDITLAEGTIFELEGGKAYYLYTNTDIMKGFTLRTRKEDAAQGKRATVYMSGIDYSGINSPRTCNWIFGKAKASGEADAPIFVDDVIFEDIDFAVPLAQNYNDQEAGMGGACGNYFANMYSSGLAVTFNSFQIKNCTFQGFIRGFLRTQGSKRKTFNNILIENNVFWNCMNYNNKGQGYCWIASDGTPATGTSNVFNNCIVRNNTIIDCPNNSFFNDNNKSNPWPSSVKWNIEFDHNTIINFNTVTATAIFGMRYIPTGSKYKITNNLFVVAKDADDERATNFGIADFRQVNGTPTEIFFEVHHNYGMSWDPTRQEDDKVFTSMGLSSSSNTVGKFKDYSFNGGEPGSAMHPDNDLVVRVGKYPLLPTELMSKVNPPTHENADKTLQRDKHRRSTLDLYYNTDSKVTEHEIYQQNIGDYRWKLAPRENWTKTSGMPAAFHALGTGK